MNALTGAESLFDVPGRRKFAIKMREPGKVKRARIVQIRRYGIIDGLNFTYTKLRNK